MENPAGRVTIYKTLNTGQIVYDLRGGSSAGRLGRT
jgi:hypothetical protein